MTLTRSHLLVSFLALSAAACDNRLLVGQDPDGGLPSTGSAGTGNPGGGSAGTAGPPTTGAGGGAATSGTGGVGTGGAGTGGSNAGLAGSGGSGGGGGTHLMTPLQISGEEAVYRAAQVIWRALPDDDLFAQARQSVKTPADLHGPVRQLLSDSRARIGVGAFYRWWLDLDEVKTLTKDAARFPEFTPALAADLATETETFGVMMTLNPNGTYQQLMTAPYTYANTRVAALYGVAGFGDVATFARLDLDAETRAGLLTQPALQTLGSMDTRNMPTVRGGNVMSKFFCRTVPPPPAGIPQPKPIAPGMTTREWLSAEVSVQASCSACHGLLDPAGYAFEAFDAIGRSRTTDNGRPVDVSNLRINLIASAPLVDGPVQLANAIANSAEGRECMVRQWLSYVLARPLTMHDEPSVAQAVSVAGAAGFDLKEVIFAVLASDAFLAP
jgi:hypothetical protein